MLGVLLLSIPMYICATASTPVAASMLLAGISPGTVLVFLLAGPATNFSSAAILRREWGWPATAAYLVGIAISSLGLGLIVDALFPAAQQIITPQIGAARELFPRGVAIVSLMVLIALAAVPLGPTIWRRGK
jgi:hypothetical protein